MTLREIRVIRGLSLRQVAELTRIAAPHLSEIERGLRLASPEQLGRLADAYGVSREGWRATVLYTIDPEVA